MKSSIIFAALISIAACSCSVTGVKKLKLTEADNNKTVQVVLQQEIELRLRENPSTGYEWHITANNTDILQPTDDQYKTDRGSEGRDGAGGTHTWHFKMLKAGTAELQMVNSRSWEKDSKGTSGFKITIVVK